MADQNEQTREVPANVARLAGRHVRVNKQLERLSGKLQDPNLDPKKREIIEKIKIPELVEELELIEHDYGSVRIRERRASGVEINVPLKEFKAKEKPPEV